MLSRPDQFLNEDKNVPIKLRLFDEDPPDTILVTGESKLPSQRIIEREFRKHGEIKSISKQDGGYVITFACAEGWCIQALVCSNLTDLSVGKSRFCFLFRLLF